ncbi:MAG: hypothetical protein HUU20_24850 [Pirellulales bacterium]|nr:hypothetical protein [Pirellulales bacterium]
MDEPTSEKQKLQIDWQALEMAFEFPEGESEQSNYFDLKTGRVVYLDDDTHRALEQIEEELSGALPDDAKITADAVRGTDVFGALPQWQKDAVLAGDGSGTGSILGER